MSCAWHDEEYLLLTLSRTCFISICVQIQFSMQNTFLFACFKIQVWFRGWKRGWWTKKRHRFGLWSHERMREEVNQVGSFRSSFRSIEASSEITTSGNVSEGTLLSYYSSNEKLNRRIEDQKSIGFRWRFHSWWCSVIKKRLVLIFVVCCCLFWKHVSSLKLSVSLFMPSFRSLFRNSNRRKDSKKKRESNQQIECENMSSLSFFSWDQEKLSMSNSFIHVDDDHPFSLLLSLEQESRPQSK